LGTTEGHLGLVFTRISAADRDDLVVCAYERELAERVRRRAAWVTVS
jgi:hypothetical protein